MKKKTLLKERNEARSVANLLFRECIKLIRANAHLGEEVNFRQDKIDQAIACIKRKTKKDPAWLREVYRNEV